MNRKICAIIGFLIVLASIASSTATSNTSTISEGEFFITSSNQEYLINKSVENEVITYFDSSGNSYTLEEILQKEFDPNINYKIDEYLQEVLKTQTGEEIIPVVVVLKDQPSNEVSSKVKEEYSTQFEEITKPAKQIYSRIKPLIGSEDELAGKDVTEMMAFEQSLLTEQEKVLLKDTGEKLESKVSEMRMEIFTQTAPLLDETQASVVKKINAKGGNVKYKGTLFNVIAADIPSSAIEDLSKENEIYMICNDNLLTSNLDVSTYSMDADTFWLDGITGAVWDAAIVDSGIDGSHSDLTVDYSGVFHTTGVTNSLYNDNSASPDDLQGHGTHVAGIVASTHPTYQGVAYGIDALINAKAGWKTTDGSGAMYWSDAMAAIDWSLYGAGQKADVISLSYGGGTTDGNSGFEHYLDAIVYDLNTPVVVSAGNDGPTSGTVSEPSGAFNVIGVGAIDDMNTISRTDDSIASYSSRGPTLDGRIKPDISAPGSYIMSANNNWENFLAPDFVSKSGTSMAAPHITGSVLLILDYKNSQWSSEALKALLLNTAQDRGITGPDNDYGFGYVDLWHTYFHRDDVFTGIIDDLPEGQVEKYFKGPIGTNELATLVWNRHVDYIGSAYPTSYLPVSDLDLYLFNEYDNYRIEYSTSWVNNVEQVKSDAYYNSAVVKIEPYGTFPTGITLEDYALATEESFTQVNPPNLNLAMVPSSVSSGETFTLEVEVTNNGDIAAHNVNVDINLTSGFTIVSGTDPQNIGKIDAGFSKQATWTVQAPLSSNIYPVNASASTYSYYDTFTASLASTIEVSSGLAAEANGPYSGPVGVAISYSGSASGGTTPYSYSWNFGDGTPLSTEQNPSHTYTAAGTYTATLTVTDDDGTTAQDTAQVTVRASNNIIQNPGFESGTSPWKFYTNGGGTFSVVSPGFEGSNAANLALNNGGTNIQLYQYGITLEPDTLYQLSFAAKSSTGNDVTVKLLKHVSPYTNYGIDYTANLGTNWQTFTTEFTTTGFTTMVNDGRLQFWLAPFAAAGDTYNIDNVRLEKVIVPDLLAEAAGPYTGTVTDPIIFTGSATGGTGVYTSWHWEFGDGGSSDEQNPGYAYSTAGTYTATLTVTDNAGATADDTAEVSVTVDLLAEAAGPYTGTVTDPIIFTGSATGGTGVYTAWHWVFGDGGSSDEQNPGYAYSTAGTYTAALTVTDNAGATADDTAEVSVTVDLLAEAAGPYTGVVNDPVSFTGSATGGTGIYTAWHWEFGDGGSSNEQNPNYAYTTARTYTATLTVTDSAGVTDDDTTEVSVTDELVAEAAGPYTGTVTNPIIFTGSATGGTGVYTAWHWEFGDGGSSNEQNPNYAYTTAGTYTATLTVTDNAGATADDTAEVSVTVDLLAEAAGPYTGVVNDPVSFTGSAAGGTGVYTAWHWEFGDGGSSDEQNPNYTYTTAGTYTATLTVTDNAGATADDTAEVSVTVDLLAEAAGPYTGTVTDPIIFTGSATGGTGVYTAWHWEFGDGGSSNEQNPNYAYTTARTYTATLTVTDSAGVTDDDTTEVSVTDELVAEAAGPYTGTVTNPIIFTGSATGGTGVYTAWHWEFGDGGSSNEQNPNYAYTTAGTYTATLTVTDNAGATADDTAEVSVTVDLLAEAAGPYTGVVNDPVSFTGSAAGGTGVYTAWHWEFGDGGSSDEQNPGYTYTTAGTYTATLTVTDNAGATADDTAEVSVTVDLLAEAAGPYTGTVTDPIIFTGSATGGTGVYTAWHWEFGDGGSSNEQNPNYAYTTAGTYTATLTVTDSAGATDDDTAEVSVTVDLLAEAAGPYTGTVTDPIIFTGSATGGTGVYTAWHWEFGDGGSSDEQNPGYAYTTAGTYTAALTVTDNAGATADDTANAIVSPSNNIILNPGFETGTSSWMFYTNDGGTFSVVSPGFEGSNAANLALNNGGTNIQLYQYGITLEPDTRYQLNFAAKSSTGNDVTVKLLKHVSPYTNYGFYYTANLGTNWQTFTTEFTTTGFTTMVNDGRLQFWLAPFAAAGDTYNIDNVRLEKVIVPDLLAEAAGPYTGTVTDPIIFTGSATGGTGVYTAWHWEFGDGGSSDEQNPNYAYPTAGTYTATLTVTDNAGATADDTAEVSVTVDLLAEAAGPYTGTVTDPIIFTGSATGGTGVYTAWHWEFGDGGSSDEQNPGYAYSTAGTYTATLTVTDNAGATADDTAEVSVTVDLLAEAAGPYTGTVTDPIIFTGSATGGTGVYTAWHWVFGDGGSSDEQNPGYAYSTAGTYTAALTVTDNAGATADDTAEVSVTVDLLAEAAGPYTGVVNDPVSFTGSATGGTGVYTAWHWEFGDGGSSNEQNPNYAYTTAGTYTATLTVTDSTGVTDDDTAEVSVTVDLLAEAAGPYTGTVTDPIIFTGSATGGTGVYTAWHWVFGDGGSSDEQNPGYAYSTAGTYTATLTVTDNAGATADDTADAIVRASNNIIQNPGFETGTSSWMFYTNGGGTFSVVSPGFEGSNAANLALNNGGTNIQLYQYRITLEPDTRYQLSFAAKSSTGNDVTVKLLKHVSPYTNYGFYYTANLGTNWQTFTTEFTTTGFTTMVNDGRLQFWLAPFAAAGDTYNIDNVRLEKI